MVAMGTASAAPQKEREAERERRRWEQVTMEEEGGSTFHHREMFDSAERGDLGGEDKVVRARRRLSLSHCFPLRLLSLPAPQCVRTTGSLTAQNHFPPSGHSTYCTHKFYYYFSLVLLFELSSLFACSHFNTLLLVLFSVRPSLHSRDDARSDDATTRDKKE